MLAIIIRYLDYYRLLVLHNVRQIGYRSSENSELFYSR
jgi:hypothetical protein